MPCLENSWPKTHPTLTVSRIQPREILHRRHVFHTRCFLHYSKVRFSKYCGKRALQGPEKSWNMSTYRVPKCGRHFVKFDDVTIYPVLVVVRTDCGVKWGHNTRQLMENLIANDQAMKIKLHEARNALTTKEIWLIPPAVKTLLPWQHYSREHQTTVKSTIQCNVY